MLEQLGLSKLLERAWLPVRHLYTLTVVCVAWTFFRAETLSGAMTMVKAMCGLDAGMGADLHGYLNNEVLLAFAGAILCSIPIVPRLAQMMNRFAERRPGVRGAC